mgnify:CR=1 FL=1
MSIAKKQIKQIILEEYKALLLEFNPTPLLAKLSKQGDAKALAKALRAGKIVKGYEAGKALLKLLKDPKKIKAAIDNPGIGPANIDKKILLAYNTQKGLPGGLAKRAKDVTKAGEKAADSTKTVKTGKRKGKLTKKAQDAKIKAKKAKQAERLPTIGPDGKIKTGKQRPLSQLLKAEEAVDLSLRRGRNVQAFKKGNPPKGAETHFWNGTPSEGVVTASTNKTFGPGVKIQDIAKELNMNTFDYKHYQSFMAAARRKKLAQELGAPPPGTPRWPKWLDGENGKKWLLLVGLASAVALGADYLNA